MSVRPASFNDRVNLDEGGNEMARLTINGKAHDIEVEPDTPLLWALREQVGLTGTKYGCGIAQCGACTVHIDGVATRSCSVPVSAVGAKKVTTIELLASWRRRSAIVRCGSCVTSITGPNGGAELYER